jgi:precorrin-6B methylase 1
MSDADRNEDSSAPLAPGLYLVATPIGNLGDITLRALNVLRQADRIACEDTRQTQKLLNHFQIATPTISCHEHNERQRAAELIEAIKAGGRIAVVSDAGMPGISDPGARLASEAIAAGVAVIPIPGANAALSGLIASGLSTAEFHFIGFLPEKAGARRTRLEDLAAESARSVGRERFCFMRRRIGFLRPSPISSPSGGLSCASSWLASSQKSTKSLCAEQSPRCGKIWQVAIAFAARLFFWWKRPPASKASREPRLPRRTRRSQLALLACRLKNLRAHRLMRIRL